MKVDREDFQDTYPMGWESKPVPLATTPERPTPLRQAPAPERLTGKRTLRPAGSPLGFLRDLLIFRFE